MKKVIFILTLAFGVMSFTNNDVVNSDLKLKNENKTEAERCTRMCTYKVNTNSGERRLVGCTDWTCDGGTLPEFEL